VRPIYRSCCLYNYENMAAAVRNFGSMNALKKVVILGICLRWAQKAKLSTVLWET
jgi:hypothetical protein